MRYMWRIATLCTREPCKDIDSFVDFMPSIKGAISVSQRSCLHWFPHFMGAQRHQMFSCNPGSHGDVMVDMVFD